ncbi:MAG: AAA family ATPase [Myxococcota bacterium]
MLDQVHFEEIKSLRDVTIDLARFTVLVGPNGAGKSTVLDQIARLCELSVPDPADPLVTGTFVRVLQHVDPERRRGSDGTMVWSGRAKTNSLRVSFESGPAPYYDRARIRATTLGKDTTLDSKETVNRRPLETSLAESFSWRSLRLRLLPGPLAQPSPLLVGPVELQANGYGLASLLALIQLNDSKRLEAIETDLRAVVPHFERLHFRPTKVDVVLPEAPSRVVSQGGYALDLSFRGVGRIPAHQVSDGTLLALGLLGAAHWHELPDIILLDDIDHGLHLSAQYNLIKAIRRVLDARPELQIVCTTHAPVLLDSFEVDEVRVLALDKDGATRVKPLSAHPDLERWRGAMGTGELWANLGEDWVLSDA